MTNVIQLASPECGDGSEVNSYWSCTRPFFPHPIYGKKRSGHARLTEIEHDGISIALKFGTLKEGITAHHCTNFGWNTINRKRVMSDYSRKITPICCHAYRVNRVWEEAENRWMNGLTIEPQTFCGLKEIKLKNQEDTTKKPTVCNNYAIEIS